jgi:transglutaminase-like putative cysteine protease
MTIFSVRHTTTYTYARPVPFGEHRLMFRPRDSYDQRLLHASLRVDPTPCQVRWIHDVFGNCVVLIQPAEASDRLRFETHIQLEHTTQVPLELEIDDAARRYPFDYPAEEIADLQPTIRRHFPDGAGEIADWSRQFVKVGQPTDTARLLMTLCAAIHESFAYSRRTETGTQPPLVTLRSRKGSCRDFALLMMEAVRSLGFAARFVSGYVYVRDRDGSVTRGGGATHAWCQVYLPGAGWVEFDPTNGIVGNRDLVRVAVARDPEQAIPLSGTYIGKAEDSKGMTVQVNVTTEKMPVRAEALAEGDWELADGLTIGR